MKYTLIKQPRHKYDRAVNVWNNQANQEVKHYTNIYKIYHHQVMIKVNLYTARIDQIFYSSQVQLVENTSIIPQISLIKQSD